MSDYCLQLMLLSRTLRIKNRDTNPPIRLELETRPALLLLRLSLLT